MNRHPQTIRSLKALVEYGLVPLNQLDELSEVAGRYAVSITEAMRERIEHPDDSVGRQFIPSIDELVATTEENGDPIGDIPFTPVKGITHRYPDRLLLKPTHTCAVYCRFCFRREVVGPGEGLLGAADLSMALDYIRDHPKIWEVILSGGDPLILSPARLSAIMRVLNEIDHVKVIRFHTRVPIVDPGKITSDLIAALSVDKPVWIVIHCNHSQEIGEKARVALLRLNRAGFPLLSQSVLLKGVNDTPEALEELFRVLVQNRVKPYYLHHGDLAKGTGKFRTTIEQGQDLARYLRGRVSGICQPTYVLDIPQGHGKVPIGPAYCERDNDTYLVTDPQGRRHAYPPREP